MTRRGSTTARGYGHRHQRGRSTTRCNRRDPMRVCVIDATPTRRVGNPAGDRAPFFRRTHPLDTPVTDYALTTDGHGRYWAPVTHVTAVTIPGQGTDAAVTLLSPDDDGQG